MSRCHRCNIEILDETVICPLCKGVVELDDDREIETSHSVMYPDVMPAMKRLKFIFKLVVFLAILLEILLAVINYLTYDGLCWAAICGVALAYVCFTVYYSCQKHSEHRTKLVVSFVLAMVAMVVIDNIVGYKGWSVNYVVPVMIMVIDAVILILMLANSRSWQSYIMTQLVMLVICAIGMVLVFMDIIDSPVLMIIATGVTGIILLGTLILGDRKASVELFRRFKM